MGNIRRQDGYLFDYDLENYYILIKIFLETILITESYCEYNGHVIN